MTSIVTSVSALQTTVGPQATQAPWYQRSEDEAPDPLGTTRAGLSQADATALCAQYRPNGLDEPPHRSPLATFAAQLPGIMTVVLIAAVLTSCETVQSQSSPQAWGMKLPDADVTMKGGTAGAGLGYLWGHGMLKEQAEETAFCIRGLSIGEIGGAALDSRGFAHNLKSLNDFAGTYIGIYGGFAVVRGESGLLLRNNHGVELEMEARQRGLLLSIAASGVRIVLANTHGCKAAPASAGGGTGRIATTKIP